MASVEQPLAIDVTPGRANADIWQKVIALDSSYANQRSLSTRLTPAQLNVYLRRRCQLSRTPASTNAAAADRTDYLLIRQTLLANK